MSFNTTEKKASYGIGLQFGRQLKREGFNDLCKYSLQKGIEDALLDNELAVPVVEIQAALQEMHQKVLKAHEEQALKLKSAGTAFLEENAKNQNVKTTQSGLQYLVLNEGNGDIPTASSTVKVHYTGTLIDGTVFDSSVERGQPAEFPVNGVIKGWTEALQMMKVGSKWRLFIPENLAYGQQGAGASIPPYSALIFDVELLEVN